MCAGRYSYYFDAWWGSRYYLWSVGWAWMIGNDICSYNCYALVYDEAVFAEDIYSAWHAYDWSSGYWQYDAIYTYSASRRALQQTSASHEAAVGGIFPPQPPPGQPTFHPAAYPGLTNTSPVQLSSVSPDAGQRQRQLSDESGALSGASEVLYVETGNSGYCADQSLVSELSVQA
jgi:hypothetical protein